MAPSHDKLKVLLLQARNTQDIEVQEQTCFLERCRLQDRQLDCINLGRQAPPSDYLSVLDGYDALLIGGAGEYSAMDDTSWMPFMLSLVQEAYNRKLPTFGSCWGHQIIARALGGEVQHDPDKAELGCHHIELTEAGRHDELLGTFPHSFMANMGHHDRVTRLPEGAIELADNRTQPNEAFRLKDRPMYGTQFHSELDAHRERERLIRYRAFYMEELHSEDALQAIFHGMKETTEVDHLMFDFLTLFAVEKSA